MANLNNNAMATKINIIITDNNVYATYVETICYKGNFIDEDTMSKEITQAKAIAFDISCTFGSVLVSCVTMPSIKTDEDVFKYLKNNN